MEIPSYEDLLGELEYLIRQIPPGKVSTYSSIARALGDKIAAKFVYQNVDKINAPFWRVVNYEGKVRNKKQELLLRREGVEIKDGKVVNLKEYLFEDFKPGKRLLHRLRSIQKELVSKISLEDEFKDINYIGGVDLSYSGNKAYVVISILDASLNPVEDLVFEEIVDFPYIPSFLAFREGLPIIRVLEKAKPKIDILFVNGHGIAHPVKLGLATFVGVLLDIPTIGVTKALLVGNVVNNKILLNGEQVGWVLEKNGNKCYASPGHRASLNTAYELSKRFWISGKYPEPIRRADSISKRVKKGSSDLRKYLQ